MLSLVREKEEEKTFCRLLVGWLVGFVVLVPHPVGLDKVALHNTLLKKLFKSNLQFEFCPFVKI